MRCATLPAAAFLWAAANAALADDHGQALYMEHCAACHGAQLEGQPNWREPNDDGSYPAPPHDASGHTWHHGDAMLFDYVKRGGAAVLRDAGITNFRSAMPGFGEVLSDADIAAVLGYIHSTWPPRIRVIQQGRTAAETQTGNRP